ncbi:MAG TPA: AAA family ATPase [bacterium]|nr:AAA family ATPase [bacterium]HPS28877.1 AAA family ATPase [bacterium]
MKRMLRKYLESWKISATRRPLIIKGARQVGKSWLVRDFGTDYNEFVEINFEYDREAHKIFKKDNDPLRIIRDLRLLTEKDIQPGKTLLFLDEIQACPEVITVLRYFYEKAPEFHVIAAGSLLNFTLESIGLPVGRVEVAYLYPLSFFEFLEASGHERLIKSLYAHNGNEPILGALHEKLLKLTGEYMAVGGMPAAVELWIKTQSLKDCMKIHQMLIETYRQDFNKYAALHQQKYVDVVFEAVPRLTGRKFVYSSVSRDFRSRELRPAFDLIEKAGIVHPVMNTSGNGIPLGSEADPSYFKAVFFDVALMQAVLGLEYGTWIFDSESAFVNRGAVCECFVGQEIAANGDPFKKSNLFYWARDKRGSSAEIDYLLELNGEVIPLEVKSGGNYHTKSMNLFLEEKSSSPYGILCSTRNFGKYGTVRTIPIYAVGTIFGAR